MQIIFDILGNCETRCTYQNDPICGTNDQTYSNQCFLSIATCNNPSIKFKHWGTCGVFYILLVILCVGFEL